ncbi:DUF1003 domain-containing protein [Neosynechococcus sphagnicola]|uniref:DUF1003 domain-containing protein n=1 Tax=Neosynechococcus sphagnicola TaxID=1501145 RepID=UPI00068A98AB|nr:DUF1003 domain-containing protein [Neosynechococcus sphagnicola]
MKPQQSDPSAIAPEAPNTIALKPIRSLTLREIEHQQSQERKLTLGQRIADKMAAKVGSWTFLIGQTTILLGWIVSNSIPGIPHWDEQPFILLNLVFSFASAYTAPIVLMSQNRQSDAEREKAEYDRQVNLKAGYDIELLHEKIDALQAQQIQAQQIQELMLIVKEHQHSLNEVKSRMLPVLQQPDRHPSLEGDSQRPTPDHRPGAELPTILPQDQG